MFKKTVSSSPKNVIRAVNEIMEDNPDIFANAPESEKRKSKRHEGAHAFGIFLSGITSVEVSLDDGSFTLDYSGHQSPDQQEFTAKAPLLLDKRYSQNMSKDDLREYKASRRRL